MENQINVAVAYDLNFRHAGEIFQGVCEYVRESGLNWRLIPLQYGFETTLMQLSESGQLSGAIGTFISDRWIAGLHKNGVHAINLFNFSEISCTTSVCLEDFSMGQEAAQHLQEQGADHFAYYASGNIHFNELRRNGFDDGLGQKSYTRLQRGPLLHEQITSLNKDDGILGVFCSSDRLAREYILKSNQLGLECGHDYLLTSIDNEPTESIFARIGITSFELPMIACGKEAAKQLQRCFSRKTAPKPNIHFVGPSKLIIRDSSLASRPARLAQAAVNYIHEHFQDAKLDTTALARAVNTSRRVLELALREAELASPYQLISRVRLNHAQHCLTHTDLPIMEVGRLSGYPEPHHFSAWFKARTGQSPRSYRLQRKTPSV
ncbi:MAG: helix-turn-helix domain-containing protein [Coraliomargaritaceae bacterium]